MDCETAVVGFIVCLLNLLFVKDLKNKQTNMHWKLR